LQEIQYSAFSDTGLAAILIPASVLILDDYCLANCKSFSSLAFENESQLKEITISSFDRSSLESIIIPASVTIARWSRGPNWIAFRSKDVEWNTAFSVFFAPDSKLERIEESAFSKSNLKTIIIPRFCSELCEACFSNCDLLESIGFEPDSQLLSIGKSAFQGSALKWIVIPKSVKVLSESSFEACNSLQSIGFEDDSQLITIDAFAFARSGLKSIVIPSSVEFIDGSAFIDVNFDHISMSNDDSSYRIVGNFLQDVSGQALSRFFGNFESLIIAPFVSVLRQSSFASCKSLVSVVFEKPT
jgi:hypothetical protein